MYLPQCHAVRMLQIRQILLGIAVSQLFVTTTYFIKSPTNLQGIPAGRHTALHNTASRPSDTIPTVHLIREIENQYIISLETPPSGHPVDSDILIIQSCKHIEQASPLIILLTNIRSPSFNAGSIESEGILNEVKQNSCIKNRTTTMQNMKKAKFSNIARILFILLISSPLVESIYDKPPTLTHISHVRHFHPIIR